MTNLDKLNLDFTYEVKLEFYNDEDVLNTNNQKREDEITVETEVFYKETFNKLTNYDDLVVEAPRLCSLCDQIFINSYSFLRHNVAHLKVTLERFKAHSCNTCSSNFLTVKDLKNHQKICQSNNNNDSVCPICEKNVKTSSLKRHIKLSHSNVKIKCNICGVMINSSNNLRRHILNMHEKRFKICEHCGKNVKERYYGTHIRKVHQNNKVKCDLCCKYFKSKMALTQHKLYIHDKAKLQNVKLEGFKCDKCYSFFKCKNKVMEHVSSCEGVPCKLCNAKLRSKQILKNHIKWVHYEGESHSCDECGKVFKSPYCVRTHKKNCHAVKKTNEGR